MIFLFLKQDDIDIKNWIVIFHIITDVWKRNRPSGERNDKDRSTSDLVKKFDGSNHQEIH